MISLACLTEDTRRPSCPPYIRIAANHAIEADAAAVKTIASTIARTHRPFFFFLPPVSLTDSI